MSRGDLNRQSLTLQAIKLLSAAERLAWLADQLGRVEGHGIIYALTKRDVEQVADWLRHRGFNVEAYTSDSEDRAALEQALQGNQVKALVATVALGMGYDKPDLRFVFHYQMPGSVVAYYQQVGRAGRAVDTAYGVLLHGEGDKDILDFFTKRAFPSEAEVESITAALGNADGPLTVRNLLGHVNIPETRLDYVLNLLSFEVPAPFVKQDGGWQSTATPVSAGFWKRAGDQTALRQAEQQQMCEYVSLPFGSHMRFLVEALDGDGAQVTTPRLPPLPSHPSPETIRSAETWLRGAAVALEPRKRWPEGGLPAYGLAGSIPAALRAQPGRALCRWRDAGWGRLVHQGKYEDNHFSDELAEACAALVRGWNPQPPPAWVTAMPSVRAPALVASLAERVATRLSLPSYDVLAKTEERPSQKSMRNSVQQARNLDGALAVRLPLPPGPVLLVDDACDSRWTLTVAAWLLLSHGAEAVHPVVLADAAGSQ